MTRFAAPAPAPLIALPALPAQATEPPGANAAAGIVAAIIAKARADGRLGAVVPPVRDMAQCRRAPCAITGETRTAALR